MGLCRCYHNCCGNDKANEVYTPRRERWCTDVLCLVLLILAWGGMGTLGYMCAAVKPQLLWKLYYPTDSYGQFCGRLGSATEHLPVAFYADLDADIEEHWVDLVAGRYVTFLGEVTTLCAARCPDGVSLTEPTAYGGAGYPLGLTEDGVELSSRSTTVPTYFYSFRTEEFASRCLPTTSSFAGGSSDLCASPPCTDAALNATLGGTVTCAALSARPSETSTWEVCPSGSSAAACAARRAACAYAVTESSSWLYLPQGHTAEQKGYTDALAAYVRLVIGGFDGVIEAWVEVAVFGAAMPIGAAFVWLLLLRAFAGAVVWLMLSLLVLSCALMSVAMCLKAGWLNASMGAAHDALAAHNLSQAGAALNTTLAASSDAQLQVWYEVGALVSLVATVLVLVLLCAWRRCIARAIAIVRECTKVFGAMPLIVLWPLLALVFEVAFLAYGLLLLFWIWDDDVWVLVEARFGPCTVFGGNSIFNGDCGPSSLVGDELGGEEAATSRRMSATPSVGFEEQVALSLAALLIALWSLNFCRAISWTSMASAVGYWFVVDNAPHGPQPRGGHCLGPAGCGLCRLLDSTMTVCTKHLGSMAFGSLIIAACQLVRICLKAVEMSDAGKQGLLVRLALKCAHCAMFCLQRSVEFVSYYGYVYVALEGGSFCKGCKSTFHLVARFPAQVAVNKTVQKLLALLMGWSTPGLCALSCYYRLDNDETYTARFSAMHASVVAGLMAWVIADGFTTTFTCCVDTIYISAFVDMESNHPPKYLSNDLREGFGLDRAEEEAPVGASKLYRPVDDSATDRAAIDPSAFSAGLPGQPMDMPVPASRGRGYADAQPYGRGAQQYGGAFDVVTPRQAV